MPALPEFRILACVDKTLAKCLFQIVDFSEILIVPMTFIRNERMEGVMKIVVPLGVEAVSADI